MSTKRGTSEDSTCARESPCASRISGTAHLHRASKVRHSAGGPSRHGYPSPRDPDTEAVRPAEEVPLPRPAFELGTANTVTSDRDGQESQLIPINTSRHDFRTGTNA